VTAAVAELLLNAAVTVTDCEVLTVPAAALNATEAAPAATVTEDGVVNAVLLSDIETAAPPAGAA